MKHLALRLLLGLSLVSAAAASSALPAWAARNPAGHPVRIAVPAPSDPSLAHLAWPKVVKHSVMIN
ncbi:MAG: hypothetical protein FJ382_11440 [Verrucomicrobia bacterium]|nr:hypothetical protein [Verrucomicrobiota bacterium]